MNKTTNVNKGELTDVEKMQLIEKIRKENDPQRKVDKIVMATKICMKESRQAKVDKIVAEQLVSN